MIDGKSGSYQRRTARLLACLTVEPDLDGESPWGDMMILKARFASELNLAVSKVPAGKQRQHRPWPGMMRLGGPHPPNSPFPAGSARCHAPRRIGGLDRLLLHQREAIPMITGTFLDEITHDIPYQNWGANEWAADFRAMKEIGIDTVIIIRAGYKDRCTFDSKVIRGRHPHLLVDHDLVDIFLTEAENNHMNLFFGTYDSGEYWHSGQAQKEVDINKAFTDEFMARYGHRKAFGGWYICHEINSFDETVMNVYEQLATHLRGLRPLPILISPYIKGIKQFDDAISLDQHQKEWGEVFARIQGKVDIVAFQDGHVDYPVLQDYLQANAELARRHGITSWSNVESFDRDMPIKFPPIGWPKLKFKIDAAQKAGVDKLITFEFSHFLSPHSMYQSAHMLNRRYREHYLGHRFL
jgi:hypothetical protein